jgi:hypothetical protein
VAHAVNTYRIDDVDGSAASQTITFGIDRQRFEIDLSDANATALRDVLAPYIAAGRRTRPRPRREGAERAGRERARRQPSADRSRTSPTGDRSAVRAQADDRNAPSQDTPAHVTPPSPTSRGTSRCGAPDRGLAPVVALQHRRPSLKAQLHKVIDDLLGLLRKLTAGALAAVSERIVALVERLWHSLGPSDLVAVDARIGHAPSADGAPGQPATRACAWQAPGSAARGGGGG